MRFRDNAFNKLTNPFASGSLDDLVKKWPRNGLPILEPLRYAEDEKALIPTLGQIIRASHFNQYSDSIVSIQYFIRNNAGLTWTVDSNGTVTECPNAYPINPVTAKWDTSHNTTALYLSTRTVTASGSLDQVGSGSWNFQTYIDIPLQYGVDPWASNNFGVILNSQLVNPTQEGLWSGSTTSVASKLNSYPFLFTSSAPDQSNPRRLNIYVKVQRINNDASGTEEETFTWTLGSTRHIQDIQSNPTDYLKGYLTKTYHPSFKIDTLTSPSITPIGATSRSLSRVQIQSAVPTPNGGSRIYPYGDNSADKGCGGGLLYRNRSINPDAAPFPQDYSIEFSFNGFDNSATTDNDIKNQGGYITKSGLFLRGSLYTITTPGNMVVASLDYKTAYYGFKGYLLRFNAQPCPSGFGVGNDYDPYVGTWAIMKVEDEQFGTQYGDYDYWWDKGQASPPTVGVETTTPNDPVTYHDTPLTRVKVLAYSPGGEQFIPLINRTGGGVADSGTNWRYKFQVEGDTISVWKRNADVTANWTLVTEVVDSAPITSVGAIEYIPAGIYCKGAHWRDGSLTNNINSSSNGSGCWLSLANIVEKSLGSVSNPSVNINIRATFFGMPGQNSVPPIA